MNASVRATLVGAVVGLIQFIIVCWRGPDIGVLDMMGLIFVPYSLGFFFSWWGMLPRWGAVAAAGPAVTAVFILANIPLLGLPGNTYLGDWPTLLSFMALSAASYLAAGGLIMPVRRGLRALAVGGVAVAFLAVWSAQDTIAETARAHRLALAGVPLVAPTLPAHHLVYVDDEESWLQLWYSDESGASTIEIAVGPESAATPKAACKKKSPPWREYDEGPGVCREAATASDVWLRNGDLGTTLFATTGNALVRIESTTVPEEYLIDVLRTFHPVEPSDLVELQEAG